MLKIGLTGGPGTGKSTVLSIFKKLGSKTVSSDEIVRSIQKPRSPLVRKISRKFGQEYVRRNGSLNRPKLRRLIFNFPKKRKALERLVHPLVLAEREKISKRFSSAGVKAVIFEVPLLFEAGLKKHFDIIIVVSSKREIQLKRLKTRDGMKMHDALKMIGSQLPLSFKESRADYVIRNNRDLARLKKGIGLFVRKLDILKCKR